MRSMYLRVLDVSYLNTEHFLGLYEEKYETFKITVGKHNYLFTY